MAILRKMLSQVRLSGSDAVGANATVSVMKAGALTTGGGTNFITCLNTGSLAPNARCYAIDAAGVKVPGSDFLINNDSTGVAWDTSAFKVSWSNNPVAYTRSVDDRIVFDEDFTAGYAEFYDNDTGSGTPITAVQTLGSDGELEGYVKVRDVDLIIGFGGATTYKVDVVAEAREFVTPEDFGAVGDGSTDDRPALQNALDYLSYVQTGGELFLGAKTYFMTLSNALPALTINSDKVSVIGQGKASVLSFTPFAGLTKLQVLQVAAGADDILLKDFVVDASGGSATLAADQGAIQIGVLGSGSGTQRVRIDGVSIKSRFASGIAAYGGGGLTVRGCTISNDGGITGGHGILLAKATGGSTKRIIIEGCQLYDSGTSTGAGIAVDQGDRVIITASSVRGWTQGIDLVRVVASNDVTVSNCHIRNQAGDGIRLAAGFNLDRLLIDGNTIHSVGNIGLFCLTDLTGAVITGNSISDTNATGAYFNNASDVSFTGNLIRTWNTGGGSSTSENTLLLTRAGLAVEGSVTDSLFASNVIAGSANADYCVGMGTDITDCTFMANKALDGAVEDWYWGEPTDNLNNTWFNPDHTTGEIRWGDPDGTGGSLMPSGDIDLKGNTLLNAVLAPSTLHYGSCFFSTPGDTTITTGGTYVKCAGTTTVDIQSDDIDATTGDNRIQYTGTGTKVFAVAATIGFTGDTPTETASFRIYKFTDIGSSGTTIVASQIDRKGDPTAVGALALHALIELDPDDYIELHCTRVSSGKLINVNVGHLSMTEA